MAMISLLVVALSVLAPTVSCIDIDQLVAEELNRDPTRPMTGSLDPRRLSRWVYIENLHSDALQPRLILANIGLHNRSDLEQVTVFPRQKYVLRCP